MVKGEGNGEGTGVLDQVYKEKAVIRGYYQRRKIEVDIQISGTKSLVVEIVGSA